MRNDPTRMKSGTLLLLGLTLLIALSVSVCGQRKPNVIIIMTDQQQAHAFGREGFGLDTSPFRDALARKGVWFNRAYTSTPECAPARVSLLTGRFCSAHGVRANPTVDSPELRLGTTDMVSLLHSAGYTTALIGKNHTYLKREDLDYLSGETGSGKEDISDEQRQGEEEFDRWLVGLRHRVEPKPTPFPIEYQHPYRIVTDAEDWIEGLNEDQPFFLEMSFTEPHNPYQVPEPYFSMFPPESIPPVHAGKEILADKGFVWQFTRQLGEKGFPNYEAILPRMRANYYGMIRLLDDQIGRFVQFLEDKHLTENTLIFIIADHGDYAGEYGLMRKGAGVPEVLTRIPFQVYGYQVARDPEPQKAFVSIIDVFPTICDAVQVEIPAGVQGRSLWPMITGQPYPEREFESIYVEQGYGGPAYGWDDPIDFKYGLRPAVTFDELNRYSQAGLMRMVRKGDWKLIVDQDGNGQLYDLGKDPFELVNLYARDGYGDVKIDLLKTMVTWMLRSVDPLPLPGGDYKQKKLEHNYWTEEKN
jgi:arylsulfatase A-like enzyme